MEEKTRIECPWCGEMKIESAKICGHCGRDTWGDAESRITVWSGMRIAVGFAIVSPVIAFAVAVIVAAMGGYR